MTVTSEHRRWILVSIVLLTAWALVSPVAAASPEPPAKLPSPEPFGPALMPGPDSSVEVASGSVTSASKTAGAPLAARERDLSRLMPPAPEHEDFPRIASDGAGRVAVFWLQDQQLMLRLSNDGGSSYGEERRLVGSTEEQQVFAFDVERTKDGVLYVAAIIAESDEGAGLYLIRSENMGGEWSDPIRVCGEGDPGYPVVGYFDGVWLDAVAGGRVAVAFYSYDVDPPGQTRFFATVSSDYGRSWSPLQAFGSGEATYNGDIAILPGSGRVVFAFADYGIIPSPWVPPGERIQCVQVSTSSDGGQTWTTPDPLEQLFPGDYLGIYGSVGPVIARGSDDSVNIFAWTQGYDAGFIYRSGVRYARSEDGGASFDRIDRFFDTGLNGVFVGYAAERARNSSTILLALTDANSRVRVHRSDDDGAWFGDGVDLGPGRTGTNNNPRKDILAGDGNGAWALLSRNAGDLHLHRSTDDGVTWEPPRALGSLAAEGGVGLGEAVAATGSGQLRAVWGDERPRGGMPGFDIYTDASTADGLEGEVLVNDDGGESVTPTENAVLYQGSGGDLRTAFLSHGDVYLSRSPDRGRSHDAPRRVSGWAPGEREAVALRAEADDVGEYLLSSSTGEPDNALILHRSEDGGETFSETTLATGITRLQIADFTLSAPGGGRLHAAWYEGETLVVGSSRDGGGSFETTTLQPDVGTLPDSLAMCAGGDTVVVTWRLTGEIIYAAVSDDGGRSFGSPAQLQEDLFDRRALGENACLATQAGDRAVAAYVLEDRNERVREIWTNRWQRGSGWSEPSRMESIEGSQPGWSPLSLAWADAAETTLLMAYQRIANSERRLSIRRSSDDGITFDDPNTLPGEYFPSSLLGCGLQADGGGRVWAYYRGYTDARYQLSAARSDDFGASFGPLRRVGTRDPRGYFSFQVVASEGLVVYPGEAVFGFTAQRRGYARSPVVIGQDLDDRDWDGADVESDCAPQDPDTYPGAPEICDGKNNDCDDPAWPDLPLWETDQDGDGVSDCRDNCVGTANPSQGDSDLDGTGDACEITVTETRPGDDSVDAPVLTTVLADFSAPVDRSTVDETTMLLSTPDKGPVSGEVGVSADGLQASFMPDEPLSAKTLHTVELLSAIRGQAGGGLSRHESLFETGEQQERLASSLGDLPEEQVSEGEQENERHGEDLAYVGDVNGDGIDDRLVGAPGYDTGKAADAGRVLLYLGSEDAGERDTPDVIFEGASAGTLLGDSVGGGEDVDGDGRPDLILGAPGGAWGSPSADPGRAYLVLFDPGDYPNLADPAVTDTVSVEAVADSVLVGAAEGDLAGHGVDLSADVNGDGFAELLVGSPGSDRDGLADRGAAALVFGGPDLPSRIELRRVGEPAPDGIDGVTWLGSAAGDALGWSVSADGDVDGDGTPDVALGAPFHDVVIDGKAILEDAGLGALVVGPFTRGITDIGKIGDGPVKSGGVLLLGDEPGQNTGSSVAIVDDRDVDGDDEFLVGAPRSDGVGQSGADPRTDAGEAFLLPGAPGGELPSGSISVAGFRAATDPLGTAYQGEFPGDELGFDVGSAGDTDGDRAGDLLLGAPGYDVQTGKSDDLLEDAGSTYLDPGTPGGPFTRGITDIGKIGDEQPGKAYFGDSAGARSGSAVAGGGDFDGDGLDDFSIGAPGSDEVAPDAGESYNVLDEPLPVPRGPEPCDATGCNVRDLSTGSRIEVSEGALEEGQEPTRIIIRGYTEESPVALPTPAPVDREYLGYVEVLPEDLVLKGDGALLYVPLIDFDPDKEPFDEAPLRLFRLEGDRWVDTGTDGKLLVLPGEEVSYQARATIDRLGRYALFRPERNGNAPPVADSGAPQTLECTDGGAVAVLDGSGSSDPDGVSDIVSYEWSQDGAAFATGVTVEHTFPLGQHSVELEVEDTAGQSDTDSTEVGVQDTLAPAGRIVFPSSAECFGPADTPVVVTDDFTDRCAASLTRSYSPGPGPEYSEHGDYPLTLQVSDPSENAASAEVAFTIDLVTPVVEFVGDVRQLAFPTSVAFPELFATGDADGAAGGIVHEVLLVDDCTLYDGDSYGDRDGLLSDEQLDLDRQALCELAERCGTRRWQDPVVEARATDCGGNTAAASFVLPGGHQLVDGACR